MVQGSSFLSTIVFLQPPSSFCFSSCYISWFLCHIHYPRVSQELGASCPISHLLEHSIISCKAACLLFRHHLHINAARELVGQHLMRKQQFLQIFVIPHPYPLSGIYPSPYCKIPLLCYIQGLGRFLATSDRGSEMVIILGHG